MKKKCVLLLLALLLAALLSGCADSGGAQQDSLTQITLNGDSAQVAGGGASASGGIVTISSAGSYSLSGRLDGGQIIVDTGESAMDVTLILNGVELSNPSDAAIHVLQAKNLRIQLAPGTENRLSSGTEADMAAFDETASGAVIYAEDDVDIEGEGALSIYGYINNGITCKDDLDINSGTITVLAANNGLRGSESVEIKGGSISVTAGNDGVKSTSADKEGKGYVTISGGQLSIFAQGDGISAETELNIEGGVVAVYASGDPALQSSKAIKAGTGLNISGGELDLEAADHAVHSAAGLNISGGIMSLLSTEGKGIAAHGDILISGGELSLDAANDDGIETPGNISLRGGNISLITGEDGLQAGEANSGLGTVDISGGVLQISAYKLAVNARGQWLLSGGSVLALSGSDKQALPGAGGQSYILCTLTGAKGEALSISAGGQELSSATAGNAYNVLLFSAPELSPGTECTVRAGAKEISAAAQ